MAKYHIPYRPQPRRKYTAGAKAVLSIRAPKSLKKRLSDIAKAKGYSLAELMEVAFDQFCQHVDTEK